MVAIRVYNFYFFGVFMGIVMGMTVLLLGLTDPNLLIPNPLTVLIGLFFLGISSYTLFKILHYKLELQPGLLQEFTKNGVKKIPFENIQKLETEIILGAKVAAFTPIFYLTQKDGNIIQFKTQEEASVYSIVQWVKDNYPHAQFTENTNKVLNWAKSGTWLFRG